MKAITVWQPWASLIVAGMKQYETRGWATKFRGRLAIHAAKTENGLFIVRQKPLLLNLVCKWLGIDDISELPLGAVIGSAELVDCKPTKLVVPALSVKEHAFGDFSTGRFAWQIDNTVQFAEPIPIAGKQGFWNWEGLKMEFIEKQY